VRTLRGEPAVTPTDVTRRNPRVEARPMAFYECGSVHTHQLLSGFFAKTDSKT